jgi:hypothetical protein
LKRYSPPPAAPQLYHITHVDNLAAILATGGLLSDVAMIARGGPNVTIGMSTTSAWFPAMCDAAGASADGPYGAAQATAASNSSTPWGVGPAPLAPLAVKPTRRAGAISPGIMAPAS